MGEDLAGVCRYAGVSFHPQASPLGKGRRFTGVVGPEPPEKHGMRSKVPNFVELRLGFFSCRRKPEAVCF